MEIQGVNFGKEGANSIVRKNAAPNFINTIFPESSFSAEESSEAKFAPENPEEPSNTKKNRKTQNAKYKQVSIVNANTSAKYPDTQIDPEIFAKAVDNVIKNFLKKTGKSRSALSGTGKTYINIAKQKNVNPFILLAINIEESAYGTSKAALNKNNVGGLMKNGKTISCSCVNDSISISANVLNRNVYEKNLTNLQNIGMKGNYCCADTSGRTKWIKNIVNYAVAIQKEYNRLLSEV